LSIISQLYISPSYVPIDSSTTLINAKIIQKLDAFDIKTTVLTVSPDDTHYVVTPDLSDIFKSDRKVYRLRSHEVGGKFLMVNRKILRRALPVIFFVPDYHFVWEFLAILELLKIKRECNIDIIQSVSAPYCSHIVGYFAKKILKKPWICHLDDFWADQPAEHFDRYRFINRWLEKKCFEKADVVLSSSKEILELARLRYPDSITKKFIFIPPCYEPRHYPESDEEQRDKYVFSFMGGFYPGKREARSLFAALQIIKNRCSDIYSKLQINLIGIDQVKYQKIANDLGIGDVVKCQGRVNYLDSMKLMRKSSVLIHLGYMNKKFDEDIHISGKLFEYLGAERLVLSITTTTGPVADFTRDNKGIVCDYKNPEDIADKFVEIVSNYSIDDLYNWKNPIHVRDLYSSNAVAAEYKKLFERLVSDAAD